MSFDTLQKEIDRQWFSWARDNYEGDERSGFAAGFQAGARWAIREATRIYLEEQGEEQWRLRAETLLRELG